MSGLSRFLIYICIAVVLGTTIYNSLRTQSALNSLSEGYQNTNRQLDSIINRLNTSEDPQNVIQPIDPQNFQRQSFFVDSTILNKQYVVNLPFSFYLNREDSLRFYYGDTLSFPISVIPIKSAYLYDIIYPSPLLRNGTQITFQALISDAAGQPYLAILKDKAFFLSNPKARPQRGLYNFISTKYNIAVIDPSGKVLAGARKVFGNNGPYFQLMGRFKRSSEDNETIFGKRKIVIYKAGVSSATIDSLYNIAGVISPFVFQNGSLVSEFVGHFSKKGIEVIPDKQEETKKAIPSI